MDDIRGALKDRAFGTKHAMMRKQSVDVEKHEKRRQSSAATTAPPDEEEDPERGLSVYEYW